MNNHRKRHTMKSTEASDRNRPNILKALKLSRHISLKLLNDRFKFDQIASITVDLTIILVALVGCAISQPIQVDPELPESAQNNGTDHVIVSWDYPYKFTVTNYDLIITGANDKGSVVHTYNISDDSPGQNSPLKESYQWNVPKNAVQGRYKAELQIKTKEAGGAVHDTISRAFDVAHDLGNLRIFKYNDANGNGIYDQGEKSLIGWQFTVKTPANDNYSRNTDANGFIEMKNLPVGSYVIDEVESPGYRATTKTQQSVQVTKDKTTDAIFGNQPLPARIAIIKYEDKNRNAVKDPNETGVAGWEFTISGPSTFTATTDSTGSISKEIKPGNYKVAEVLKSSEDWQPTTPTEQSIVVEQGKESVLNFGNYRVPRSILTIIKFEDINGNGVFDPNQGEKGTADWEFEVKGQESFADKTGTNGIISRKDIKSGTYTIGEKIKQGWFATTKTEQTITINPGEEKIVYFGNRKPQLITKFEDRNANGVMDAGEIGLSGWTFEIKGPVTTTKTTDSNGQININDLPAGDYTITESLTNSDWYNTTPMSTSAKVPGQDVSFGNDNYRILKIFNFNDPNKNGIYDKNESGLEGWEFQVSGIDVPSLTNSNGIATFKVKANQKYLVSESLPANWLNSTPLEVSVQIDPTKNVTEVQFGDYQIPVPKTEKASLKIHVYNDSNRDGTFNSDEPGLSNREVQITNLDDSSSTYGSFTTNNNGDIECSLPAGTYKAEQILLSSWCTNGDILNKVTLKANNSDTIYFGSYPCISGNCEYRFRPPQGNLSSTAQDEDLLVTKSIDPYVLSLKDHDMTKGTLINYTVTVCVKPKIGPTDLILAVDTSGSVIEGDKAALSNINRGINGFVQSMKGSQNSDLRIGLVSWDSDIDETIKPTFSYEEVLNASNKLRANPRELTMYQVGMNGTLNAFDASPREGARKVIVFITDARNEYEPFQAYPDPSKYTIYVLLLNKPEINETYDMLINMTKKFGGKLIQVNDSAKIASTLTSLSKTSLIANGTVNDIKIVDTLPSYLRPLNKGTKVGTLKVNNDGVNWKTSSLSWSIPAIQYGKCWSTTFTAVFCYKLQANVAEPLNSSRTTSQVEYADPVKTGRKIIPLPEGTIWIESDVKAADSTQSEKADTISDTKIKEEPGFQGLLAAIGISLTGFFYRRRVD